MTRLRLVSRKQCEDWTDTGILPEVGHDDDWPETDWPPEGSMTLRRARLIRIAKAIGFVVCVWLAGRSVTLMCWILMDIMRYGLFG